jgi:hypothetical protein
MQEDKEDNVNWSPKERGPWLADDQGVRSRKKEEGNQRKQIRGHE